MIKRLKFKDKDYPVWVCYEVLERLQADTKKGMDAMQDDMSLYRPMLYYAIKVGADETGEKFKFEHKRNTYTIDGVEIGKILNHTYFDFIAMIPEFFPGVEKLMAAGGMTSPPKKK